MLGKYEVMNVNENRFVSQTNANNNIKGQIAVTNLRSLLISSNLAKIKGGEMLTSFDYASIILAFLLTLALKLKFFTPYNNFRKRAFRRFLEKKLKHIFGKGGL